MKILKDFKKKAKIKLDNPRLCSFKTSVVMGRNREYLLDYLLDYNLSQDIFTRNSNRYYSSKFDDTLSAIIKQFKKEFNDFYNTVPNNSYVSIIFSIKKDKIPHPHNRINTFNFDTYLADSVEDIVSHWDIVTDKVDPNYQYCFMVFQKLDNELMTSIHDRITEVVDAFPSIKFVQRNIAIHFLYDGGVVLDENTVEKLKNMGISPHIDRGYLVNVNFRSLKQIKKCKLICPIICTRVRKVVYGINVLSEELENELS